MARRAGDDAMVHPEALDVFLLLPGFPCLKEVTSEHVPLQAS
jgi:hypothetical protein